MINPAHPDYLSLPGSARRPRFGYAPALAPTSPAVSIVTPFYNVGPVFHQTAASVHAQSLQNWEWLIVNDGSKDPEALAVLDQYRRREPRIRVIDLPENRGLSGARNEGYRQARADLVFQIDGDDLVEPTMLEKCAWFLATHPAYAFVKGWTVGFGDQEYLWRHGFHDNAAFLNRNLIAPTSMVRRAVHAAVGGYDESIRGGLEDWEFWLRCADAGHWGATIPEFLDWYRRRASHNDRWANWDGGERQSAFEQRLRAQFPRLYDGAWPAPQNRWHYAFDDPRREPPLDNPLGKGTRRLLVIAPWLRLGGADKFNLDLLEQLTSRRWEVTIVTTMQGDHSWMHEFARFTPDIFALGNFCQPLDMPAALVHFIRSRRPDAVLLTNSELAYHCLHYLRAMCPQPAYLDFTHMEEEYWKNGGYPRYSVGVQDQLDLSIVTSEHLKGWMTTRGADPQRVEVCYINVDAQRWQDDDQRRRTVRLEHGIDDTSVVLLYPCRLTAQKQPRVFAATVKELAARGVPFEAIVAGDGEDRPWLESFLRASGLAARVRVLGAVPLESMPGLMAAADILFLPSKAEGISLVLYEAMAAARPVVGADVGGQRELLTPDCGLLLPCLGDEQREAAAYADALAQLIADPDTRARMGAAGRQRVAQDFTLAQMGDRMDALLRSAIAHHASEPRPVPDQRSAYEIAARGVEYLRAFQTCEWLWQERVAAQNRAATAATLAEPGTPAALIAARASAIAELARIERSRSFRFVQSLKGTLVYRAAARLRFGHGWDAIDPREDPRARLARIKASRSYQMIQAMKQTTAYRWYAARKYGAGVIPSEGARP